MPESQNLDDFSTEVMNFECSCPHCDAKYEVCTEDLQATVRWCPFCGSGPYEVP